VQVDDAVKYLARVFLQRHPVLDGAKIIPYVGDSRGLDARENNRSGLKNKQTMFQGEGKNVDKK